MNRQKIGKREIAILHIAKAQLMMTEEEYRAILKTFDVTTSKDLSIQKYNQLLRKFQADGFILTTRKKISCRNRSAGSWEKEPMLRKIRALLSTMKLSSKYSDSIAKHMFGIDNTTWCTPAQLHSIIAALEYKKKKLTLEEEVQ